MASEIQADKWSPSTGVAGTIGDSGDTFTVPSGATLTVASGATITNSGTATGFSSGDNTPAFQATLSANQSLSNETTTKILCNTEDFDTDSAYDNTTNYRFTVPAGEGGKYCIYVKSRINASGNSLHEHSYLYVRKNGSDVMSDYFSFQMNSGNAATHNFSFIHDLSAADYIEFYAYFRDVDSNTGSIGGGSGYTTVGAYKMIGL